MLLALPTLVAIEPNKLSVGCQSRLCEVSAPYDEQALLLGHEQEKLRVERAADANRMKEVTHVGEAWPLRGWRLDQCVVRAPIYDDCHVIVKWRSLRPLLVVVHFSNPMSAKVCTACSCLDERKYGS